MFFSRRKRFQEPRVNQYAASTADGALWYCIPYGTRRMLEYGFRILLLFAAGCGLDEVPGFLHAAWQLATLPYGAMGSYSVPIHVIVWIVLRVFGLGLLWLALGIINFYAVVLELLFAGKDLLGNERLVKGLKAIAIPSNASAVGTLIIIVLLSALVRH